MPRHHVLVLTLTVIASLPAAGVRALPGSVAVPQDSFIRQHVDTVPQLTQQVTLDPVVRRRLARHFHTSGPAVARYIQKNLILKRLTTAKRFQVWCITKDGREYTINSRLASGTPVFVMRGTNQPVLKLACANPLLASLPFPLTPPLSPELASVPTTSPASTTTDLLPGPVVVASVPGPGVDVMPNTQISPALPTLLTHGSGGSPLGFLAGLPILYGILHHGGGNGTGTGTTGTTGNNSGGTTGTGTGTGTNTGTGTTGGNTGTNTGTNSGTGTNTGTGTTGGNNGGNTGNNSGTGTGTGMTPVPEPSAPVAFLVGVVGLAVLLGGAKRRNRRAKN